MNICTKYVTDSYLRAKTSRFTFLSSQPWNTLNQQQQMMQMFTRTGVRFLLAITCCSLIILPLAQLVQEAHVFLLDPSYPEIFNKTLVRNISTMHYIKQNKKDKFISTTML